MLQSLAIGRPPIMSLDWIDTEMAGAHSDDCEFWTVKHADDMC
jgi:hypothetical protein